MTAWFSNLKETNAGRHIPRAVAEVQRRVKGTVISNQLHTAVHLFKLWGTAVFWSHFKPNSFPRSLPPSSSVLLFMLFFLVILLAAGWRWGKTGIIKTFLSSFTEGWVWWGEESTASAALFKDRKVSSSTSLPASSCWLLENVVRSFTETWMFTWTVPCRHRNLTQNPKRRASLLPFFLASEFAGSTQWQYMRTGLSIPSRKYLLVPRSQNLTHSISLNNHYCCDTFNIFLIKHFFSNIFFL